MLLGGPAAARPQAYPRGCLCPRGVWGGLAGSHRHNALPGFANEAACSVPSMQAPCVKRANCPAVLPAWGEGPLPADGHPEGGAARPFYSQERVLLPSRQPKLSMIRTDWQSSAPVQPAVSGSPAIPEQLGVTTKAISPQIVNRGHGCRVIIMLPCQHLLERNRGRTHLRAVSSALTRAMELRG